MLVRFLLRRWHRSWKPWQVMDDDEQKKRTRERTLLFIGKKGRESAFAHRTRSAGNEIAPVK